eukprot:Phypoly_transcript_16628.p1 GENE.Phypoly_transcript_16628~~Phypoly_transcript_16628.p1  ORF type:complete len:253 (+),score=18.46 Phypoly_transcript_16628:63-761(+)
MAMFQIMGSNLIDTFLPNLCVYWIIGGSLVVVLLYAIIQRQFKLNSKLTFYQAICDFTLGCTLLFTLPGSIAKPDAQIIFMKNLSFHASSSIAFVVMLFVARAVWRAVRLKPMQFNLTILYLYAALSSCGNSMMLLLLDNFQIAIGQYNFDRDFIFSLQPKIHLTCSIIFLIYAIFTTNYNFNFGSAQHEYLSLSLKYGITFLAFWTIPMAVFVIHSRPQVALPLIVSVSFS